jgi:hypothetical protein
LELGSRQRTAHPGKGVSDVGGSPWWHGEAMKLFWWVIEKVFIGFEGKNIFRTMGCIWVFGTMATVGFWALVILALVKYIKS